MSLFKVTEYSKFNYPQRCGAFRYLTEHYNLVNSLPYPIEVLDIGCGSGENTKLLTYFPNVKKVVAFDRDMEMVAYAECFNDDYRIQYACSDVSKSVTWPKPYENAYDLAVSFFVLHWIHDQERALRNIYQSLKNGAYFLCRLVGRLSKGDLNLYKFVAENPKWRKYGRQNSFFPVQPWMKAENPAESYAELLKNANFQIVSCKNTVESYLMSNNDALEYLKMSRLHHYSVPTEDFDEFAHVCFNAFYGGFDETNDLNKDVIKSEFCTIDFVARKSAI